jgi:uncharacterized membrane protein YhaH (DUF805 family)
MTSFLAQTTDNPLTGAQAAALGGFFLIYGIVSLAVIVLSLVCNYQIVKKAGYNGWLSLLMLIPLVNVVCYVIFAFSDWPVNRGPSNPPGSPYGDAASGYLPGRGPITPT